MAELFRHVGASTDVPAGDIGVGGREIGFLYGMYRKLANEVTGVLTGKGHGWGGSLIRPEATGYGAVYFVQAMLATRGETLAGKRVAISGSGNVAQYASEKLIELGARVVSLSDSSGSVFDEAGIDAAKLAWVMALKNDRRGRMHEYVGRFPEARYLEGQLPWSVPCDVAVPCASQNEISGADAEALLAGGCRCVAEGANMPCAPAAVERFQAAGALFGPGKAANAGGVAVSGLEMTQNAMRLSWTRAEVDARLRVIMDEIHATCVRHGRRADGSVDYVDGANIGGFMKVADAMLDQGVV
jgi:glutamate dehydrogenase (NADP+)